MQAWSGTRKRAWVIATVVGVWGVAELIAGFAAIPALGAELSPAQIVALRFPTAWHAPAHSPSPTTPVAARGAAWQLASSEIFNPYPTYATRSGEPALADAGPPQAAMAYADPATEPVAEFHHGRSSGYQLPSATPAAERRARPPHRARQPGGAILIRGGTVGGPGGPGRNGRAFRLLMVRPRGKRGSPTPLQERMKRTALHCAGFIPLV